MYKTSDCFNKKLEQFAYIDKLTYNLSKKIRDKCCIENIDNKKLCKTHCKAFPIYKKLQLEFIKNRNENFVHFKNKNLAKFAWNLYRTKFMYFCCGGCGLKRKDKFNIHLRKKKMKTL